MVEICASGAVSGLIGRTATAPLERVRIMYQTNPNQFFSWKDFVATSKRIYATEGIPGLFRGNFAEAFRVVPYAMTSFVTFDITSDWLSQQGFSPIGARFLGGSMAGCAATALTYPSDLIRARMAAHWHATPMYESHLHAYESVLKSNGVRGLYRGIGPSLIGVIPYGGILFTTFETIKASYLKTTKEASVPSSVLIGAGIVAGILAQIVTYPLHTIRRRIQVSDNGQRSMFGVAREIIKQEGWKRGMYKGVTVTLIKAPISKGLTLALNDIIKKTVSRRRVTWDDPDLSTQGDFAANFAKASRPLKPTEQKLTALERGICGSLAGMCAKTVIAPGDRVKILFQTSSERVFSMPAALRIGADIAKKDGVSALWRGNSASLLRIAPYAAISYSSFDFYKETIDKHTNLSPVAMRLCAGSLAGLTASSCTYPLDLMRARMAVSLSEKAPYRSYGHAMTTIVEKEGPLALFRGLSPTLLGIIPYAGLSFGVFETLKAHYKTTDGHIPGSDELPIKARLVMGAFAGLFAQTATYPLDVVRRRFQVMGSPVTGKALPKYTGIYECMVDIIRKEGIRGLYSGVTMNWVKGPIVFLHSIFNIYHRFFLFIFICFRRRVYLLR